MSKLSGGKLSGSASRGSSSGGRSILYVLIILLVLGGGTLIGYPYIRFFLSSREEAYALQVYDESVNQMNAIEQEEIMKRAKDYNDNLVFGLTEDPFTKSPEHMDINYASQLSVVDSDVMGFLAIPNINVRLPIYHGTSKEVLDKGCGHMEGSSLPIGGVDSHSVITGHTGLPTAMMLTDIIKLADGDIFYLEVLGSVMAYRVYDISVVEPEDISWFKPVSGKDVVSLLTCTPYGVNSHRLIVTGERVPYTDEEARSSMEEAIKGDSSLMPLYITSGVVILLIIIFIIWKKKKEKA